MPLRFAGQYSDDEVGLFYNYFRFYDPATGRYIENDPIDLQGGLNRYGYVGGSPLHFTDIFGLAPPRGERGATGGVGGKNSNNPYKHCREFNPPQRNFVECRHHQSGKYIKKPRPPEMPYPNSDRTNMCSPDEIPNLTNSNVPDENDWAWENDPANPSNWGNTSPSNTFPPIITPPILIPVW